VIDHFEKVTDRDAALMTRRIAREEGIIAGNSAGSAMAGLLQLKDRFTGRDLVVVIFHDHGSRYLGKMFNDEWMREKGFLEKSGMTAASLVASGLSGELCAIEASEPVEKAVQLMREHDFSQISISTTSASWDRSTKRISIPPSRTRRRRTGRSRRSCSRPSFVDI
jgi:cystathionine beta-synthase